MTRAAVIASGAVGLFALGVIAGRAWEDTRLRAIEAQLRALSAQQALHRADDKSVVTAHAGGSCVQPGELSALRDQLLEELRQQAPRDQKAAPAPSASAVEDRTPEAEEGNEQAQALVQRALASKSWSRADALRLRLLFPSMSREDREAAIRALVVAVNEGRIRPEPGQGPLF